MNMGINLKRQGRLDEALIHYKRALELDPSNPVIMYNIGILFNIRSEYDEAIQALHKSIEFCTDNSHAYLALGDAYERMGNLQQSLQVFQKLSSMASISGLREKIVYLSN